MLEGKGLIIKCVYVKKYKFSLIKTKHQEAFRALFSFSSFNYFFFQIGEEEYHVFAKIEQFKINFNSIFLSLSFMCIPGQEIIITNKTMLMGLVQLIGIEGLGYIRAFTFGICDITLIFFANK